MAHRLGVTTPAVNKWENENSYPDISLLTPIARLLGISLDTLLSYQENLTEYEIKSLINTAVEKSKNCSYEEIFLWAKDILETYPNCLNLTWQLATLLDVWKLEKNFLIIMIMTITFFIVFPEFFQVMKIIFGLKLPILFSLTT